MMRTPPTRYPQVDTPAEFTPELDAEAVTIRIRWFGLMIGALWVNIVAVRDTQTVLNSILLLGVVYALLDSYFSLRGAVFLGKWPLFVSAMEAVFIGLLCQFDEGPHSSFRFYYCLSLLVCALRHSAAVTYATFAFHAMSFAFLVWRHAAEAATDWRGLLTTLVLLPWVTWAATALGGMLQRSTRRMSDLNQELRQNQLLLEERIAVRTRELQQSQAMLVQHEKQAAFGLLAAGIAHEVGNPLAAISSIVQLLNRREIDDHTREKLSLVDDQLRRIQRTLRELVDFSRPASHKTTMCDVHEVIEAALSIAKYYKRKKGRQIVTDYAEGVPPVRLIRDELVQVFLNLILNALDATPEGGEIRVKTCRVGDRIRISMSDTGCGILPEHQGRIFQPYFTTKETGTGLGLFVCRNMIEQNARGRIELTASSAAGTTFTVELPCQVDPPAVGLAAPMVPEVVSA